MATSCPNRPRQTRTALIVGVGVQLCVLFLLSYKLSLLPQDAPPSLADFLRSKPLAERVQPQSDRKTEEKEAFGNRAMTLTNHLKEDAIHPEKSEAETDDDEKNKKSEVSNEARIEPLQNATVASNVTGIPDWLKEYIVWHREQRKDLTPENWRNKTYLVMQCAASDNRCGGTADRLKPVPYILFLAYQSKRIFLIHWERPCEPGEFLQPPEGSLDWRTPAWMAPQLGSRPIGTSGRQLRFHLRKGETVVRSRYQSWHAGAENYDADAPGPPFNEVFHYIWRAIFEPVPAIAKMISDTMKRLELRPGEYAAAHLRALYAVDSRPDGVVKRWAENAVNCASTLRPGGPIYFASDSKYAVEAVQNYAKEHSRKIFSVVHEKEPLHLELSNWTQHKPADYYDTFVDIYLLGMSRCVAYNVGGFGKWGLILGYNASCGLEYGDKKNNMRQCKWVDAPSTGTTDVS